MPVQILIDGDGCPVVDITAHIARKFDLPCKLICDTAHVFQRDGIETVTVSKGADSADYALVNLIKAGDVVVTQDYGLAAMSLARGGRPITQNGLVITDMNMGSLLESRHIAKKIRNSGGRLKGPSKRTKVQDEDFAISLTALLQPSVFTE